jgi:hypothetical protein
MDYIPGRNIIESEVDDILISDIARRLGIFHTSTLGFPFEQYSEMNYHRDRLAEFRSQTEVFVYKS